MLLRELMTSPVLTVTPGQTASDALASMRDENVRHAVVVLGSTIVGVVSDRDLGGAWGGRARLHQSVADRMSGDPIVARPSMRVERAIRLVRERHIGCLPVVSKGKLVGIVTRSDLLRIGAPSPRATERPRASSPPDDAEKTPILVWPDRDRWP